MNKRSICTSIIAVLACLGGTACGSSSSIIPPREDNNPEVLDAGFLTQDAALDSPVVVEDAASDSSTSTNDGSPIEDSPTAVIVDSGEDCETHPESGSHQDSGTEPDGSSTLPDSGDHPDSGTHQDSGINCDAEPPAPPPPVCHTVGRTACSDTKDCPNGDTCTNNCCISPPPTCQQTCQSDYSTCVDTCKSQNICDLSLTECDNECQCKLTSCLFLCVDSGCTTY